MILGKRFRNSTKVLMRFDLADTCRLTDRGNGADSQKKVKIVSFPISFGIRLAKNVVDEVD